MKAITVALPTSVMPEIALTPEDIRTILSNLVNYYECLIKPLGKEISLYSGNTTKYTIRLDDETSNKIKKYAKELNITILMFTSCIANMYYK